MGSPIELPAMTFEILATDHDALVPAMGDLEAARRHLLEAELASEVQRATRDRILAFCDTHPDALYRSCVDGHLTGSALVVDPGAERSLLIHHVKLDRWLQPGGHADGDGNLGSVAWREATEETGLVGLALVAPAIDVDIHAIPARGDEPEHLHLDLRFLVLVGEDATASPNHETRGARWMTADDRMIVGQGELERAVVRALAVARDLAGSTG